jgi:hypothetical protein
VNRPYASSVSPNSGSDWISSNVCWLSRTPREAEGYRISPRRRRSPPRRMTSPGNLWRYLRGWTPAILLITALAPKLRHGG